MVTAGLVPHHPALALGRKETQSGLRVSPGERAA